MASWGAEIRRSYSFAAELTDSKCFADVGLGLGGITITTFVLYFYMVKVSV